MASAIRTAANGAAKNLGDRPVWQSLAVSGVPTDAPPAARAGMRITRRFFNLDGSTLYLSLAAVFVAQAAGVDLTIGQQVTMLITLMLTSKGVAGVPRASLVILAGTLASYNLPLEGITLILGVDALMDMGRTMTNVIGNCLASVVVAKWEGEFRPAPEQTA